MMTKDDLENLKTAIEYPLFEMLAPEKEHFPFIVWQYDASDNVYADDAVYERYKPVTLTVYTINNPSKTCNTIEDALDTLGIPWASGGPVYVDSNKCFMCDYW